MFTFAALEDYATDGTPNVHFAFTWFHVNSTDCTQKHKKKIPSFLWSTTVVNACFLAILIAMCDT